MGDGDTEAAGEGLRVLRVVGEMRLDRRPIGNLGVETKTERS